MISLTEEQRQAIQEQKGTPLLLMDPATQETFILLRAQEYARLKAADYDATPWTDEEMDLLAAEDADALGWEGMDQYQANEP